MSFFKVTGTLNKGLTLPVSQVLTAAVWLDRVGLRWRQYAAADMSISFQQPCMVWGEAFLALAGIINVLCCCKTHGVGWEGRRSGKRLLSA